MALRIRADGRVLCAAHHSAEPGDTYLDDAMHYFLSVEAHVLVTEPIERHRERGEWWWAGNVPAGVVIDPIYHVAELDRLEGDDEPEVADYAAT